MRIHTVNGGRKEGSTEAADCVPRALAALTNYSYDDLQTHYFETQGRMPGEPTRLIPGYESFDVLGFHFEYQKPRTRVKVKDLDVDRNKNYLVAVDFEHTEIGHVFAVVDAALWDNSEAEDVEEAWVAGAWLVSPIKAPTPPARATETLEPRLFIQ